MNARDVEIIIVGAGIGGLVAALSLHQAGFQPIVYEAVNEPAPLGVGINLLPHATRELTELDLLPDLRAAGVEIEELLYLTKHGKRIWREPRGLAAGYNWPQIAIHRGEFQMLLLRKVRERLGVDSVRTGHRLVDLIARETQPEAAFEHQGRRVTQTADVIIGADGIHSAVRKKFYPDEGMPKWNGVTLWRSTTQTAQAPTRNSMLWCGHARQKFVCYPIGYDAQTGETLLNWICDLRQSDTTMIAREDWNRRGAREDFLPLFQDWRWQGVDVAEIVNPSSDVFEFPMVDRDPLPRWTHGAVTLLGDAAHPMYPIGSNGATQAIIDARCLAFHLATAPSTTEALALYEAERRPATSRIVLTNRANGPDQVMELAEERAPNAEDDLDSALPMAERQAIADSYKRVAGFDPATLNARASFSPPR